MLKVTLKRSLAGRSVKQKACAKGLGLRGINSYKILLDTKENRGMINKISFLVEVEESADETK